MAFSLPVLGAPSSTLLFFIFAVDSFYHSVVRLLMAVVNWAWIHAN